MVITAVSTREDHVEDIDEIRDCLDQRFFRWAMEVDLVPLVVCNGFSGTETQKFLDATMPRAVILTGGQDLGVSQRRDITERHLIQYAIRQKIPLLGICRGMQVITSYFGGTLKKVKGHVKTRHSLSGEIAAEVNSYHNFSIDQCPSDFRIIATSPDGEIEAIRNDQLGWEGWMWHPERESAFDKIQIFRARALLSGSIE